MKLTYVGFSINIQENIRFLLNKTARKVYYIFFTFVFSVRYNKSLLVLKKNIIDEYIIFVRKQIAVMKLFFFTEKNKNCLRYNISFKGKLSECHHKTQLSIYGPHQ